MEAARITVVWEFEILWAYDVYVDDGVYAWVVFVCLIHVLYVQKIMIGRTWKSAAGVKMWTKTRFFFRSCFEHRQCMSNEWMPAHLWAAATKKLRRRQARAGEKKWLTLSAIRMWMCAAKTRGTYTHYSFIVLFFNCVCGYANQHDLIRFAVFIIHVNEWCCTRMHRSYFF